MRFFKSPLAGALVFLGAVYFIVILGSGNARTALIDALGVPDKAVWCTLVAVQITAWTFVIVPAYRRALRFSGQIRQRYYELLCDIVTVVALCAILIESRYRAIPANIIVWQWEKMAFVSFFGAVTVLPCLLGVRLVSFEAGAAAMSADPVAMLGRLEKLHADLRWFLLVASGVIAGATLTRGALHNAILATHGESLATGVILYGAFCSGVVALFYVPAHVSFVAAARAALNRVTATPPGDAQEWLSTIDRRNKLETSLGINVTAASLLGELGAIVAPFVVSAASYLLGLKK